MADSPPFDDIQSLWQETAVGRPQLESLGGDCQFDVAIVGGGYTGLSTARYLARRGLSPVVLEASRIGWGASGRNGGVVSGKFRMAYSEVARRYGIDAAREMHDLGLEAIAHVGELVDEYGIAGADYQPNGSMLCAHNPVTFEAARREAEWLRDTLGDDGISVLSAEQVTAETGSPDFVGGILNSHGGVIHPLNYVLGIAAGLHSQGVAIYEKTPVTGIRRDGDGVLVDTPRGTVRAAQAVIATNSYSDLTQATSKVRKGIVPFRSAMVATAPLTSNEAAMLLTNRRSYSETRRMMRWFRKSGDRLLYGGRGAFGKEDSESAFAALHKAMLRQFPMLSDTPLTHRWSGLVAMTLDSLPHLGRLDDRIVYAVGYNGTGVAMSSYMGKHVAALVAGESPSLGLVTAHPLKSVPFYGLREPVIRLVAGWYQFLDSIGR